jgi:hypothetical protein
MAGLLSRIGRGFNTYIPGGGSFQAGTMSVFQVQDRFAGER